MKAPAKTIQSAALILCMLTAAFTCPAENKGSEKIEIKLEEVSPSLVLIRYRVGGNYKNGNGVIVEMGGKSYILTNQHLLLGSDKMEFKTATGKKLTPVKVELSTSKDLARLEFKEPTPGLAYSTTVKKDMPLALLSGAIGGAGKLEPCEIEGLGGTKFQISAEFGDNGNGAPALDANKQVVGIASYSRESSYHAMKAGTRFEGATRHFCYRVDQNGWKPVNWRTYNRTFGKAYLEHKSFAAEILNTLEGMESSQLTAGRAGKLATGCRTHARQIRLLTEQRGITGFLLNELEDQAELFEYMDKWFSTYARNND